jgi:protein-tyrosine phosphatase
MPKKLLFVCLGNICRSPAAEGVFLHLLREAGIESEFEVDSAGTGGWHAGESADRRMRAAAQKRGVHLPSVARQVRPADFERFDLILAMDSDNQSSLLASAPPAARHKVRLFRDWDDQGRGEDVPDPYYGGPEGFDLVLDIVTRSGRALLAELRAAR